jgi:hypothetical protein
VRFSADEWRQEIRIALDVRVFAAEADLAQALRRDSPTGKHEATVLTDFGLVNVNGLSDLLLVAARTENSATSITVLPSASVVSRR